MTINLHHSLLEPSGPGATPGSETQTVVLLHGLFGMGANLGALARELQPDFRVYSLDLPNHGRSDWLDNADIATMARCVEHWMSQQALGHAHFVGHSLGGKVSMSLALQFSPRVASLCIADIAPVAYPPRHDKVIEALLGVARARCQSRAEARQIMSQLLEEATLIDFLLMSLARDTQGVYRWRFNLDEIVRNYDAIRAGVDAEEPYRSPVLFIKGGDSDYILPAHREVIVKLFPAAEVRVMPGCGHWLHAQKPRVFNGIVRRFLAGNKIRPDESSG